MNGDEARVIFEKLDKLADSQAETRADVAALRAELKTTVSTHAAEIKALFAGRREHDGRIGVIEQSYVRRPEHRELVERNRIEHETFGKAIGGMTLKIALFTGGLVVLWGLLQLFGPGLAQQASGG